eukprot:12556074-Alexandrium_andersonii.AAC.1
MKGHYMLVVDKEGGKGLGLPPHWLRNGIENCTTVPRGGARGRQLAGAGARSSASASSRSAVARAVAHLGVGDTPARGD